MAAVVQSFANNRTAPGENEDDVFMYVEVIANRVAKYISRTNEALSGLSVSGVDGVTAVAAGERVLCTMQTNPANNGVYVAATGAWTRASDFNTSTLVGTGTVEIAGASPTTHRYTKSKWRATWPSDGVVGSTPMRFKRVWPNPPLTFHHGHAANAKSLLNDDNYYRMFNDMAQDWTLVFGDLGYPDANGYDRWANSTGRLRHSQVYNYLVANFGCFNQRLALSGQSMGGGTVLNVARYSTPGLVGAVCAGIPLTNLAELRNYNNNQYRDSIDAAYAPNGLETADLQASSPVHYGAAYPDEIPTALFSSPGDTVVSETSARQFSAANPGIEHYGIPGNGDHGPAGIACMPLMTQWLRDARHKYEWEL